MGRTPLWTETTELRAKFVDDSSEDNEIGSEEGCRAQNRCRDSKMQVLTQWSFE